MPDYENARNRMVEMHIAGRGVCDERVLHAMREVPRERFVDAGFEEFAYEDGPLPIAEGQTISQPFIVAHMIEAADLGPTDKALEVGTGYGYAAAVLSRVAAKVFTIERHPSLAQAAHERLKSVGYHNVEVKVGDGTKGWPEEAPFNAIVVAAGGPSAPPALKDQLDIGGRLIMPVGRVPRYQRLMRITRVSATRFKEEDLGGVMFVPLIGAQGWDADSDVPFARRAKRRPLPQLIAEAAEELPGSEDPAFGEMFDRFGDRRVVLLGEASHGTSEFYQARAAITKLLIRRHGFGIVAVEADWPDAAAVNRFVRALPTRKEEEPPFQRFPTWMWRNSEVDAFVQWLRRHNDNVADEASKAGFYGLDIYNMSGSIAAVLAYLDSVDPASAAVARERYGCLTPWQNDPATYGRAVLTSGYSGCEEAVVRQCRDMLGRSLDRRGDDDLLDARQSARLIASAEKYYRIMYYGGAETWNLRDRHMFETLDQLLDAQGADSRAVVWAHNSHIGDARHTEMGTMRDELNIGQLCRERFGDQAALIGFGTNSGTVAAASHWGGEMEIKAIRPSIDGSYEQLCHDSGKHRFLLDFSRDNEIRQALSAPYLQRFIGVVYRPETERLSHYMEAAPSRQFDAFVWFDRTQAVEPIARSPSPQPPVSPF